MQVQCYCQSSILILNRRRSISCSLQQVSCFSPTTLNEKLVDLKKFFYVHFSLPHLCIYLHNIPSSWICILLDSTRSSKVVVEVVYVATYCNVILTPRPSSGDWHWIKAFHISCLVSYCLAQSKELRQFNIYKMQSNFNLEF